MNFTKTGGVLLGAAIFLTSLGSISAYHVDFKDALSWMHAEGLTKYNTEVSFRGTDSITRGEASKFTASFAASQSLSKNYTACTFSDISGYDSTLTPHISNACKYGLLKGSNGRFMPNNNLTYAQGVTLVVRALDGFQNESGSQRWANYYKKANERGMELEVNQNSANNVNISRKQLGLLFYQAHLISSGKDIDSCDGTCEDTGTSIHIGVEASTYISYQDKSEGTLQSDIDSGKYEGKNVIINFHASRCPTCNALLEDINENISDIPSNTVILQADYDTETNLKKEYGVVRQTTFVYLDTNGNFVKKVENNRSMKNILDNL